MNNLGTIFKRELASYFLTPLAYIFIVIFLLLNGIFTFYLGQFSSADRPIYSHFSSFIPTST